MRVRVVHANQRSPVGSGHQAQNSARLMVAAAARRGNKRKDNAFPLKICERHDAMLAGDNRVAWGQGRIYRISHLLCLTHHRDPPARWLM